MRRNSEVSKSYSPEPADNLLAHLLSLLVGPGLDQPQQAQDLPEVAASTTKLTITESTEKKLNI